jgi:hypothetical protein
LKLGLGLLLAVLSLLTVLPVVQAANTSSSSSPTSGYAAYSVHVTQNGTARTIAVNESVTPSSNAGKSILLVTVEAASSNFTYSHIINSSSALFPYLPAIANESYSNVGKSYNVTASISKQGTSQVTFQGKGYTLTNYAFSAKIDSAKGSRTISGSVSAFPSDLVYSASSRVNKTSVVATLTSTSLPLGVVAAAPALQAASAGLGISLAVGAVALSLGIRMKRKHGPSGSSKPDHWVD